MVKRKAAFVGLSSSGVVRPARQRRLVRGERGEVLLGGGSSVLSGGVVLPHGVEFERDYLSRTQADKLMRDLRREVPFQQGEIKMFGKTVKEPRLAAWYGEPYKYSGKLLPAVPLSEVPPLAELCGTLCGRVKAPLNSVLLNLYRDGSDYMGWHSDDERELGPAPDDIIIASVSLGAAREFRFKPRQGDGKVLSLELTHGSLLIMRGDTQKLYKHMVPKKKHVADERINLTFRCVQKRDR